MQNQTKIKKFISLSLGLVFVLNIFLSVNIAQAASFAASNIVSLTNAERIQDGQGALTVNPKLSAAAAAKANDMFANQYFAHTSPTGVTPWDFIKAAGYTYTWAGENLAIGYENDPNELMADWMNSTTHRENILNASFREIGVAVVDGVYENEATTIVVQEFGTSASGGTEIASETVTPSAQNTATPASGVSLFEFDTQKSGFNPHNIYAGEIVNIYVTLKGEPQSLEATLFEKQYNLLETGSVTGSENEKTYSLKQAIEVEGSSTVIITAKDSRGEAKTLNLGSIEVKKVILANDDSTQTANGLFAGFTDSVRNNWLLYLIVIGGILIAFTGYFVILRAKNIRKTIN